jgi:5'-nucleotidase / UDP-sugar diphosphatase
LKLGKFCVGSLFVSVGLLLGAAAQATDITILHTNDHHGRFWRNAQGEYGLAARKTLIDRVRAEVKAQGGHVLLLDAGDVNTGVPESDQQNAEPDFRGMSLIGYDAMAVGNHEFDKSLAVLSQQRNQWSRFPWLSANIYKDGRRMFDPYKIFRIGEARVAVLGLTTQDTAKMINADKFPGLRIRQPAIEAANLVPELRQQADVVIALTHMGHYVNGRHGYNAPGDVELARSVPGIDLIVGGHSQNVVCMLDQYTRVEAYQPMAPCAPDRQQGTWIVQAGEWGKFVGRADFEYVGGELRLKRYTLLPVNMSPRGPDQAVIPEDAQALALLQPFQDRGAASLSVPVGRAEGRFDGDRASVRSRPTNLGRLITMAMRERTQADIALVNAGSIRDSYPVGELTYRDLLKVQPFGNQIVNVTMTGTQLEQYLLVVSAFPAGSGAYAQTSGFHWQDVPGGGRRLFVNGSPVVADKNYRIALNSFIARGGDGYPDLRSYKGYVDSGFVDADAVREFIAKRGVVSADGFEPAVHSQLGKP